MKRQKANQNEKASKLYKPDKEHQHTIKTRVVVAGGSIIQYVKGRESSKGEQNVAVKSFSGATVDDMSDFLRPSIRTKPNKLIIHAGTNGVRHLNPKIIAEKVIRLAENFKKESSQTENIISSLVTRKLPLT